MADYFPVLSRAVSGLPQNTPESRRAVYERARAAIERQLRSIDPPLAEDDIKREQNQLEDAIRRLEAESRAAAPTSTRPTPAPPPAERPAPPPPPPPPPARPAAPSTPAAQRPAPVPSRPAPSEAQRREPPPLATEMAEPANGDEAPPETRKRGKRGPETRADGRPILRAADGRRGAQPRKSNAPLIAIAALLLIAVVAGAFAGRQKIAEALGLSAPAPVEVATREPASPEGASPNGPAAKIDDRLPNEGGPPPATEPTSPPAGDPTPPAETETARGPDAASPQPSPEPPAAEPAPSPVAPAPPPAAETPPPASPPPAQSGPLVAQRAILYEEGSNQQSGEQAEGAVTWRTESVSAGQNQPLDTALRGEIDFPSRRMKASVLVRRNTDATLPASHTIEIQFTLPSDFANAGIANVPGILMKTDEASRGAAVSGLSVRVTNGFFLIGLSNIENERVSNEALLRDRGWIDIPILYDNGRRAVMTLEKGTPGGQVFNDALNAWRSAQSGPAGQSQP